MAELLFCPGCGAPQEVVPGVDEVVCPYCKSHIPVEPDCDVADDAGEEEYEWLRVECPHCGYLFQVLADVEVVACPYCDEDIELEDD